MNTETETERGIIFGGTHYGTECYEYVEVLGGPVPVEWLADAVSMRRVVSHGRAMTLPDGTMLLACDADCIERALRCEWGGDVPAGTELRVESWPAVGDECHGCPRCDDCGGPCDAVDAVADDFGLAFCGSVYGNGCADRVWGSK
jgi:hypothetical protein